MRHIKSLLHAILLLAAFAMPAIAQDRETPRHGLMWNRTGLPATFPLQLKTPEAYDFFLTLTDAETGVPALAAFVDGGKFFRVLVPPGTFRISIAYGETWAGESQLFGEGDETRRLNFQQPLTFGVSGFNRKSGYQLDLTRLIGEDHSAVTITPQTECQTVRRAATPTSAPEALPLQQTARWLPHRTDRNRAWQPEEREEDETVAERLARAKKVDAMRIRRDFEERARDRQEALPGSRLYEVSTRPCLPGRSTS